MFEWKEAYSVGNEVIDQQHKKLLSIGDNLYQLVKRPKDDKYDEIVKLVDELRAYTIYHFSEEEKLMEEKNYMNLDVHKLEHKKFVDKMNELSAKDIDLEQNSVNLEMLTFIANWIEGHILKVDRGYKGVL